MSDTTKINLTHLLAAMICSGSALAGFTSWLRNEAVTRSRIEQAERDIDRLKSEAADTHDLVSRIDERIRFISDNLKSKNQ